MRSRSPSVAPEVEEFSLDLPQAVKNFRRRVLEVKRGEVVRP